MAPQLSGEDTGGGHVPRLMTDEDMSRALRRMAHEILERRRGADDLVLMGIHTRGAHMARRIGEFIATVEGVEVPVGALDISAYRDDHCIRSLDRSRETVIPCPIEERSVIIVDDVLFTGRTARAALDALTEIGRARVIQLAVLVDRGHRELPIRADYVGRNVPTSTDERIRVKMIEEDGIEGVWIEVAG